MKKNKCKLLIWASIMVISVLFTGIPERIFLRLELDILYGIEQGKGENLLKVFHSL